MLNNEESMGRYRNGVFQNIANVAIALAIIVLSTMYAISTLFPNWLR
jgi:hypothetical protein